ncbi:hypothetical protein C4559_04525 [Candidatus Microgenomates bacterium]|nr:MAG: hypothetical protein C4559_04525 [Candidatus Microgenomates bacterium]
MPIFDLFASFLLLFAPISPVSLFGLPGEVELSSRTISLEKRYAVKSVNDVFKDNMLLNLAYMRNEVKKTSDIDWNKIRKPFHYGLELNPDETFAYSQDVLPEYKSKINKTTNAHFNSQEGFKSDGYLVGDGVCHLASIIYWAAKDAGLDTLAPTNHDFAAIPEIPKEYGVSIYYMPGQEGSNARQNLYINNNTGEKVIFKFDFDGENLKVTVKSSRKTAFKA